MSYSVISLLAFLLLIVTNHDVLIGKKNAVSTPAQKSYRCFLIAVMLYYISDILWGILDRFKWMDLLFIDTVAYLLTMALGLFFWTQYVIAYLLKDKKAFRTFLNGAGVGFLAVAALITVWNIFDPVMFWFDEENLYHTGAGRNVVLLAQLLILSLTSSYALYIAARTGGAEKKRHMTIGLFGIIMFALIIIQFIQPYLPLYAMGYMLGCGMLRTFVIENEREEYRRELEAALAREKRDLQELNAAWKLAYTDPLTGAKSKLAFAEKEEQMDRAINDGTSGALAIVVFDVNGLKQVNDTAGHEAGDRHIISACALIREVFPDSTVFRVGGDEFVTVLEGRNFDDREWLMARFNQRVEENRGNHAVVIAAGIAEYEPGRDNSCHRVFECADFRMYQRKKELKRWAG